MIPPISAISSTLRGILTIATEREIDYITLTVPKSYVPDAAACKIWHVQGAGHGLYVAEATVFGNGDRCYAVAEDSVILTDELSSVLIDYAVNGTESSLAPLTSRGDFQTIYTTLAHVFAQRPLHGGPGALSPLPIIAKAVDYNQARVESVDIEDDCVKITCTNRLAAVIGCGHYDMNSPTNIVFDVQTSSPRSSRNTTPSFSSNASQLVAHLTDLIEA